MPAVIEKIVKGIYVLYNGEEPPRTHNIYHVFRKTFSEMKKDQEFIQREKVYVPFFEQLLSYYISERYPSYKMKLSASINKKEAAEVLTKTKEVFTWLESLKKL